MATKSKLAQKVQDLLRNTNLPYERIAIDTDIPVAWLFQFRAPSYRYEPSAARMERLYEYLTGKELEF